MPLASIAARCRIALLTAPWAPGLHVAFARWQGDLPALSPLGTGTGATPEAARIRALGEIVENLSIGAGAHPMPVPVRDAEGVPLCPDARALPEAGDRNLGSEGCAAQQTVAAARLAAFCERAERAALALWWTGTLGSEALPEPPEHALYRRGQRRRCRMFALPLLPGLSVRLVLCDDGAGGRMALGSAAHPDPATAAEAALREALQAELAWLAPPHHPDAPWRDRMQADLLMLLPALAASPCAAPEAPPADLPALLAELDRRGLRHGFADLARHPDPGLPVQRFVCPDWPRARPLIG